VFLYLNFLGGKGYSAYFDGNRFMTIPHIKEYESQDLTVTFWIFLIGDSTGGWRTIFHKGETAQDLTPTVMLWPKERRLHVRVATDMNPNEGLDSKAVIPLKRWTQIAIIYSSQLLQLYVNGLLDSQAILKGPIMVK
jgi:hypothetical protein